MKITDKQLLGFRFQMPSRRYLIAWTILMVGMFLSTARYTHAVPITGYGGRVLSPNGCSWTNAVNERQAVNLGYGFAALGAGVGIFFPPFAIGGLIIGGISGAMDIAMTMSGC